MFLRRSFRQWVQKHIPHCANCVGNHCAYSKECVEWIKQEITRVKYEQNTSFGEAKKIVEQTMLNNITNRTASNTNCAGVSYVQAVARKLTSVTVQTDLSFTPDSIVTITVTNSKIGNSPSTSAQTSTNSKIGNSPSTSAQTSRCTCEKSEQIKYSSLQTCWKQKARGFKIRTHLIKTD